MLHNQELSSDLLSSKIGSRNLDPLSDEISSLVSDTSTSGASFLGRISLFFSKKSLTYYLKTGSEMESTNSSISTVSSCKILAAGILLLNRDAR